MESNYINESKKWYYGRRWQVKMTIKDKFATNDNDSDYAEESGKNTKCNFSLYPRSKNANSGL